MRRIPLLSIPVLAILLATTACAGAPGASQPAASVAPGASSASAPSSSSAASSSSAPVVGTLVRFESDGARVDVTLDEDNPTVRDLLTRLPLQLRVEEYAGTEKIAVVPDGLDADGSPGSDPEDGHLIYYVPWGNLGFYYDASDVGYSDQTVHIGTYDASVEQLAALEGPVTVSVAP